MGRPLSVVALAPVLAASILAFAPPALADGASPPPFAEDATPPDAAREAARALAWRGYETFREGRFALSLSLFRDAEARFHAPTNLLYMARNEVELGHWIAAAALYDRLIDEVLAADASQPFRDAQGSARRERTLLETTIPALRVLVRGPAADAAQVTVDGVPVVEGQPHRLDPGEHVVKVTAPGYQLASFHLVADGGGIRDVPIEMLPVAPRAVAPSAPAKSDAGAWRVPVGVTAIALGALSVAGGATATVRVAEMRNDHGFLAYRMAHPTSPDVCVDANHDPSAAGRAAHAMCSQASALVAAQYALYGAGIAFAGAGTFLLLSRPRHADSAPSVALAPTVGRHGAEVAATVAF